MGRHHPGHRPVEPTYAALTRVAIGVVQRPSNPGGDVTIYARRLSLGGTLVAGKSTTNRILSDFLLPAARGRDQYR